MIEDPLNAFCRDTEAFLQGADNGPLAGLTFAAKDIFDVAGHVCGCGNPDWKATHGPATTTAWVVQTLVDAGATMVGKTHTDELTRGILGENVHYGTPINPRAPDRVPGGSSSGSAAAVAGEVVDFALGSDTGGSVRIPASFCGLFGLRPSHGRIPLDGMFLSAPSYDTIGWFARDAEIFSLVGEVLLGNFIEAQTPQRLLVAEDIFEASDPEVADLLHPVVDEIAASIPANCEIVRLAPAGIDNWLRQQTVLGSSESLNSTHEWIDRVNPRFGFEVALKYADSKEWGEADVAVARQERDRIRGRLAELLTPRTIICFPTAPFPAPVPSRTITQRREVRDRITAHTCVAGAIGAPQINLPLADLNGLPVGLALLGEAGADELLIAFAREIIARFQLSGKTE